MASKKLLTGIDAGTTGVTVMIADTEGNIAGTAYREYPCSFPHPGWVEQAMELMWTRICEASKEVISETGVDPKEIASLGFSSQRGTFVCVDKNLIPLADSIVWSCGRASEELSWISENLGADRYHDISGVPLSGLWSYAKMKWVVDKRPDLLDKTHLIVNGQEYFLHKFGADDISSDPASITLNGKDGTFSARCGQHTFLKAGRLGGEPDDPVEKVRATDLRDTLGAGKAIEAAEALKLTSKHLLSMGVTDRVIREPDGGAHRDPSAMAAELKRVLYEELDYLQHTDVETLVERRRRKFLNMGFFEEDSP